MVIIINLFFWHLSSPRFHLFPLPSPLKKRRLSNLHIHFVRFFSYKTLSLSVAMKNIPADTYGSVWKQIPKTKGWRKLWERETAIRNPYWSPLNLKRPPGLEENWRLLRCTVANTLNLVGLYDFHDKSSLGGIHKDRPLKIQTFFPPPPLVPPVTSLLL